MGKSVRTSIHIFLILSALFVLAGCGHKEDTDPLDFEVRSISVSGVVYDSSESLPGVPLEDITVSVSTYWYFDSKREDDPIWSAVFRTSADGSYEFFKSWSMTMQNVYFVFKVYDDSPLRTVHFKPEERVLYLRPNTDAYDDIMYSYVIKDNDFRLLPES